MADVSVIIPFRNSGKWFAETLQSLDADLRRFTGEVEVLLIDSLSQDDSYEIGAKFARAANYKVGLVKAERGGASAARNLGASHAAAQWLWFLDADDLVVPGKLAAQMRHAASARADVALIYSAFADLIIKDGRWEQQGLRTPHLNAAYPVADLLSAQNFIQIGSSLIKRDAWIDVGGMDESLPIIHDVNLYVRLAIANYRFEFCPEPAPCLYFRRHPSGSLTTSSREQFLVDSERNCDLALDYCASRDAVHHPLVFEALLNAYFGLAYAHSVDNRLERFDAVCRKLDRFGVRLRPRVGSRALMLLCGTLGHRAGLRCAGEWHKLRRSLGVVERPADQA